MISLNEQIRKDREQQYRRKRIERRDHPYRKRYEDHPNRRNYQSKRNHDERYSQHQQQKHCIKISNLHYSITKEQLQIIVSEFGRPKSCRIDWDKMGRSKETAIIQFFSKEDEEKALNGLNKKEIEGQEINVETFSQQISYLAKRHEISKPFNSYRGNRQYRK